MKTILLALLASLNIISYNIRIGITDDGQNSWDIRKPATVEMMNTEKPDIIGLQEAMEFQVAYIRDNCPEYQVVGMGHDQGYKKGEHMTFFYRKSRLECLDWGTFWLSDTPDEPSMGWDGAYERTATWGLMKDRKTGRLFYYVNTHLDHIGPVARQKGLALIVERMSSINRDGRPVVLCGDFNCTIKDPAMHSLEGRMNDTRLTARRSDGLGSFNNWGTESSSIDFIFECGWRKCTRFRTLTRTYAGKPFISDHYPISATLVY